MNELARRVMGIVGEAGIQGAVLLRDRVEPANFGDGEVVVRLGSLLLRVVRDRGDELLEIAMRRHPTRFFYYEDLEIAMGWTTVEAVVERGRPESLAQVLSRALKRFTDLDEAFSRTKASSTRALLLEASRKRGQALIARLQGASGGPA
jgi:hypothetical protein